MDQILNLFAGFGAALRDRLSGSFQLPYETLTLLVRHLPGLLQKLAETLEVRLGAVQLTPPDGLRRVAGDIRHGVAVEAPALAHIGADFGEDGAYLVDLP